MHSIIVLCLIVASTYAFRIDPASNNWKIVGGSNAPDGAYPYQISLTIYGGHGCGGSIIDEEWVITAAHCLYGISEDNMQVLVGTNKLNSGGVFYQVLEAYRHDNYSAPAALNDVALLKVKKIAFNEKVNKVKVGKSFVPADVPVILSGWGRTRLGGPIPKDLQHITLKSTSVQQCKDSHAGVTPQPVEATHLCTFTKSGEGACHGDSGGPLVTDINGDRQLVGIVSWGQPCAVGYPDVFARVSSYVGWINGICKCL